MPVSNNIRRSLDALQGAVYEEIARLVAGRAEPEEIELLSDFLKSVKALEQSPWLRTSSEGQHSRDRGRGTEVAGTEGAREETDGGGSEFFEEGEALVKKGRRRGGAGHYMQRVPWAAVQRLAETIDEKYTSRAFHPAALTRDARVPAYQSYAVLNLLSDKGFLTSPKRGSFKRPKDIVLAAVVNSLRGTLPLFNAESEGSASSNHSN